MVVAADHDRHALGHACVGERPVHLERPADLGREPLLELFSHGRQACAVKHGAQEERAVLGIRRELVGLDDVRAVAVQESRNRGDDPRAVLAGDEQAAVVGRAAGGRRHGRARVLRDMAARRFGLGSASPCSAWSGGIDAERPRQLGLHFLAPLMKPSVERAARLEVGVRLDDASGSAGPDRRPGARR